MAPVKTSDNLTYILIAVAAFVAIFLLVVMMQNPTSSGDRRYLWTGQGAAETMKESFSAFIPQMPCPATPEQILSRFNGIAPAREPTGKRGLYACAGDMTSLLGSNCPQRCF